MLLAACLIGCVVLVDGAFLQGGPSLRAARREQHGVQLFCVAPAPPQREATGPQESAEPLATDEWLQGALEARPSSVSAGPLEELRASASEVVRGAVRPKRRDEAWRRTDLSSLFAASLAPPSGDIDAAALAEIVEDETSAGMRLVLVDGAVNEELSDLSALPTDARVGAHLRRSELPGRSPSAQHVLALVVMHS